MTCDQARELLHAYLDDELDLQSSLQIEEHLRGCPECRTRLESARIMSHAAGQPGLYQPAPDDFRESIKLAMLAHASPVNVAASMRPRSPWSIRPSILSGVAAVLLLTIGLFAFLRPVQPQNVQVAELIDSHLRSLEANHLWDVESTDQHTVKPWFAGKLDFSPPVIDLSAEGFPLVGGRVDYLNEKKVAVLIYRRNKHIINLFIQPGAQAAETTTRQGFNLIRFQCKSMDCWAVSDVSVADLQQFVDLFTAQNPASTRF